MNSKSSNPFAMQPISSIMDPNDVENLKILFIKPLEAELEKKEFNPGERCLLLQNLANKYVDLYKMIESNILTEYDEAEEAKKFLEKALNCYEKLHELEPTNNHLVRKCMLFLELNKYKEAREILNRIKLDNNVEEDARLLNKIEQLLTGLDVDSGEDAFGSDIIDAVIKHAEQTRELITHGYTADNAFNIERQCAEFLKQLTELEKGLVDKKHINEQIYNEFVNICHEQGYDYPSPQFVAQGSNNIYKEQMWTFQTGDTKEKPSLKDLFQTLIENQKNIPREEERMIMLNIIDGLINEVTELKANAISREEVEPSCYKIKEIILSNKKLNSYYSSFNSKLSASFSEAVLVCEGKLQVDASGVFSKLETLSLGALTYLTNKKFFNILQPLLELKNKNRMKKHAANLIKSISNPVDRENILKDLSQKITMSRKTLIEDLNEDYQEIKTFKQKGLIQIVSNFFNFSVADHLYSDCYTILGCIDAMKIIFVISKGLIENKNNEEFVDKLVNVPSDYSLEYVYGILKKIHSEKKIQSNQVDEVDVNIQSIEKHVWNMYM